MPGCMLTRTLAVVLCCMQAATGAAGVRAAILAEGHNTLDEFLAAANRVYQEHNAKLLAEAEQRRKESQERMGRMQAEARQRHEARMRQQQHNPGTTYGGTRELLLTVSAR